MHRIEIKTLTLEQESRLNALEMALADAKVRLHHIARSEEIYRAIREYNDSLSVLNDYKQEIGLK